MFWEHAWCFLRFNLASDQTVDQYSMYMMIADEMDVMRVEGQERGEDAVTLYPDNRRGHLNVRRLGISQPLEDVAMQGHRHDSRETRPSMRDPSSTLVTWMRATLLGFWWRSGSSFAMWNRLL